MCDFNNLTFAVANLTQPAAVRRLLIPGQYPPHTELERQTDLQIALEES